MSAAAQVNHGCISVQPGGASDRVTVPITCRHLQQRCICHTSSSLAPIIWSSAACGQVALLRQAPHRGEWPQSWPPLFHIAACAHLLQGYGCSFFGLCVAQPPGMCSALAPAACDRSDQYCPLHLSSTLLSWADGEQALPCPLRVDSSCLNSCAQAWQAW